MITEQVEESKRLSWTRILPQWVKSHLLPLCQLNSPPETGSWCNPRKRRTTPSPVREYNVNINNQGTEMFYSMRNFSKTVHSKLTDWVLSHPISLAMADTHNGVTVLHAYRTAHPVNSPAAHCFLSALKI